MAGGAPEGVWGQVASRFFQPRVSVAAATALRETGAQVKVLANVGCYDITTVPSRSHLPPSRPKVLFRRRLASPPFRPPAR